MWGAFSSGGTAGYLLRLVVQPLAALDILGHDTKLSNAWVCVCLRKHLKCLCEWCSCVNALRSSRHVLQFPLRVHLTQRGGASCCSDPFTIKSKIITPTLEWQWCLVWAQRTDCTFKPRKGGTHVTFTCLAHICILMLVHVVHMVTRLYLNKNFQCLSVQHNHSHTDYHYYFNADVLIPTARWYGAVIKHSTAAGEQKARLYINWSHHIIMTSQQQHCC